MGSRNKTTLQGLYLLVEEGINEFYEGPDDYEDALIDVVDYTTPLYTSDLLAVALDYLPFAEVEVEANTTSAVSCIQAAIFDHLLEYARDYIDRLDAEHKV